jgi:hypothetical protein
VSSSSIRSQVLGNDSLGHWHVSLFVRYGALPSLRSAPPSRKWLYLNQISVRIPMLFFGEVDAL